MEGNMFIDNQHTQDYFKIIDLRKGKPREGYMERHHIIPRSLGGKDTKENMVWLSASDHFECHKLLTTITEGINKTKMWSALWRMMNKQSQTQQRDYLFTNEEYKEARKQHSIAHSQRMSGTNNPFFGQTHSDKTRSLMSSLKKGKTYEEIMGTEKAAEMRMKRSIEQSGKLKGPQKKVTCPHCGTIGGQGIMKRWHGKNCKSYSTDIDIA